MEIFRLNLLCFLLSLLAFHVLLPASTAQLSAPETRILFQLRQMLEYPQGLQGWNNWTNFCYLPPSPSLAVVCSENHITQLTVAGDRVVQKLSDGFSIDSFFTVLTKLSRLETLSLVSLGIWGPLPAKISRLRSLQVLNISSNFITGEIPASIDGMKNLRSLVLAGNSFNGSVPDLAGLQSLQELDIKNNSLRSPIPPWIKDLNLLQRLDASLNKLVGPIPPSLFSLPSIQFLNLAGNQLSGALPSNLSCGSNLRFVDVSRNLLIGNLSGCIGSSSKNRTVLSSWNCLASGGSRYQHPYRFCRKEALAVMPPIIDKKSGEIRHESWIDSGNCRGNNWGCRSYWNSDFGGSQKSRKKPC